jgi:hypothetical protein
MERSWRTRELSARRKRVIVLGASLSLMSFVLISTGPHHRWVALPCIGVEVIVLVYMLREVVLLKREE